MRQGLGTLHQFTNGQAIGPGMLNLHEAGELLRRGGLAAGLIPMSEFKLRINGRLRKLDWVWLRPGNEDRLDRVVVAFEIDGTSIDARNTYKALLTLGTIVAPIRVLLQFQVDHDFSHKGWTQHVNNEAAHFNVLDIERHLDTDLMAAAPVGIDAIVDLARQGPPPRLPPTPQQQASLQHALANLP